VPAGRYDAAVSARNDSGNDRPRVGRRIVVALGGAGVALALTGCDLDTGTVTDVGPKTTESRDVVAVAEAVGLLEAAVGDLRAVAKPPAAVAASLHLHEVHLSRLRGVTPASSSPTPATPSATTAPVKLGPAARRGEQHLVSRFAGLAQRAESGDLARLFAAMAAATSQRLEEWPA